MLWMFCVTSRQTRLFSMEADEVGELIAVVAEDGEDWKTVPAAGVGDATADVTADVTVDAAPPVVAAPVAATDGSTPGTVINMSSLSLLTAEGTIVQ